MAKNAKKATPKAKPNKAIPASTRAPNPIDDGFGAANPQSALTSPFAAGYTQSVARAPTNPRIDQPPYGGSGRFNTWGIPQWDEHNPKLIGLAGQLTFDAMHRTDPDIRRLVTMVSAPVQAGAWTMQPYGGDDATQQDRDIADTIWWALTQFMSPNFQEHLAQALPLMIRAGFAPFEQLWTSTVYKGKQLLVPKSLQVRLPRSIWKWWQDEYGDLTYLGQILPNKPTVVLPIEDLVYYRLGGEGDNWMGVSMLRGAYKSWVYKDRLERIDAIGQERKAIGVPVIYPPMNADSTTRGEVETMVASAHTSEVAYMMMPGPKQGLTGMAPGEGWLIDIVKFDSSSGDSIQASLTYHKLAIASSVLGDFMELGHHQVGARATADVQMDPFITAVAAFADIGPLPPLNKLVDRICKLNWPDAEGSPYLTVNLTDAASLSEIAAYVQLLISAGAMQADPELEDWLRERADLPAANGDMRALKMAASEAALKASALQAEGPQVSPISQTPPQNAPEPKNAANKAPAYPGNSKPPADAKPASTDSGKSLDAPEKPPNLRMASSSAKECSNCLMFDNGKCWGYGNTPVKPDEVCDSWSKTKAPSTQLDTPTAKWWEGLLAKDRLKQAFDGARDSVESAGTDAATAVAHQVLEGKTPDTTDLSSALQAEYERLYQLGHETVGMELAKQRKQLMSPTDVAAAVGARFARAKQRASVSATNIVNEITKRVAPARIAGLKDTGQLHNLATSAATAALHAEALTNTTAMVNDGRYDAAQASPDVVGAYYTAILDGATCDECAADDDGVLLSMDEASLLGPPNPMCEGGDRCRCVLVWVTSADPTAVESITG